MKPRNEAARLSAEARRLFDLACMAHARCENALDSAPILQKSLYAAARGLALARPPRSPAATEPLDYTRAVQEATRSNAEYRWLDGDIAAPLMTLADINAARTDEPAATPDAKDLVQQYLEVLAWAPDLLRAVHVASRKPASTASVPLRWSDVRVPLQAFLLTRGLLLVLGAWGMHASPSKLPPVTALPVSFWIDPWIRWDAAWYYSVVVRGYDAVSPGSRPNVVFFPLYPLVSRLLAVPLGWFTHPEAAYYGAAMAVSHAAFLVGLVGLQRLGTTLVGAATARRAIWLIALFPFSFFFSAPYPQSLLFALSIWTFLLAERRQWRWAAGLASLAAVTSPHGLLLLPALALAASSKRPVDGAPRPLRATVVPVAVTLAAPLALLGYFAVRFHQPFVFVTAFFREWGAPLGLAHFASEKDYLLGDPPLSEALPLIYEMALLPLAATLTLAANRRFGVAYGVFAVAPVLFGLESSLSGYGRLIAVASPLFLVGARRLRDPLAFALVCAAFVPALTLFAYGFCHWGHAGGP